MDPLERLAAYYAACCNSQRRLSIGPQSLGWGLLGASNVAEQWLIQAIRQQPAAPNASQVAGAWIIALFSHNERRGRNFAQAHQIPHADLNLTDLLRRREIQAVYISSHPRHHYALTMAALAAGKHVLCETPLALNLEEATTAYQTAQDRGLVLGVNHALRGHPAVQKVRSLLQQGVIGDLLGGRITQTRGLPPAQQTWRLQGHGGGVLLDRTIHTLDLVRYLLADELATVYAVSTQHILQEITHYQCEEDVLCHVRMQQNGLTLQLHDSFVIGHQPSILELYGAHGTLHVLNWADSPPACQLWLWRHGQPEAIPVPILDPYWHSVYTFTGAVRGHSTPLATAADGVISLTAALAAQRSLRERAVIPLPTIWLS